MRNLGALTIAIAATAILSGCGGSAKSNTEVSAGDALELAAHANARAEDLEARIEELERRVSNLESERE